jgi:hypothetical protein
MGSTESELVDTGLNPSISLHFLGNQCQRHDSPGSNSKLDRPLIEWMDFTVDFAWAP